MHPSSIRDQENAASECLTNPLSDSEAGLGGPIDRTALHSGCPTKCAGCHVLQERDDLLLKLFGLHGAAKKRLANLTLREYQIMRLVLAGHPSKNIAADLGISPRTVENHRASIMKRTGSKSLPELARLVLVADWSNPMGLTAQRSCRPGPSSVG